MSKISYQIGPSDPNWARIQELERLYLTCNQRQKELMAQYEEHLTSSQEKIRKELEALLKALGETGPTDEWYIDLKYLSDHALAYIVPHRSREPQPYEPTGRIH